MSCVPEGFFRAPENYFFLCKKTGMYLFLPYMALILEIGGTTSSRVRYMFQVFVELDSV